MSYLHEDKNEKFLDIPLLWKILTFAKPYKYTGLTALVALIFSNFIPFLFPHILEKIIDGPVKDKDFEQITIWLGIYLALVVVQSLLGYTSSVLSRFLAFKTIDNLRQDLFAKVQNYKVDFFHKTPIGRLMTRMTNDVDSLNSLFSEGLLDLFGAVLMICFAMIFMFSKNWMLAMTTVVLFPLMAVVTSVFRIKVRDINRTIRTQLASLNSSLQENLNGVFLVQIFSKQQKQFEAFRSFNAEYRDAFFKNVKYYSYFFPTLMSLSDLSLIACYGVGAWLITSGEISTGTLIAFAWYASMFQRPLREISDKITQLQSSIAAGERVFTLMEADATDEDGSQNLPQEQVSLSFDKVDFSYDSENLVLKDISFSIEKGQTFAFVGATGAGKSSIIHLINRFYRPDAGQILLNGVDLQLAKNDSLRSLTANVTQDVYLFEDTVAANIYLHRPRSEDRLKEVIEQCQLSTLVEFLGGLDAKLKPKELSAGQKQLFSFARALYADPYLLLLDEATSSVDSQTEKLIQKALKELMKGRTSIVVAHRLSTIVEANQILVLHQGELREQGNHQELLLLGGIYSRLVELNNQGHSSK